MPAKMLMAKMPNMSHTASTTIITLKIAPTDSNSDATISFIAILCEMTLNGLSVLSSLKILITGNSTFVNDISSSEVATIKQSS